MCVCVVSVGGWVGGVCVGGWCSCMCACMHVCVYVCVCKGGGEKDVGVEGERMNNMVANH